MLLINVLGHFFVVCFECLELTDLYQKNNMDKDQLHQFLQQQENAGIAALHARGYVWYQSEWLPRLRLGEELLATHTDLLADCWYLIGDLHDFNGAPLQAIQAYQQALAYDEDVDGAYRELAYLNELVGNYPAALDYVRQALERLPGPEEEGVDEALLEELREDLLELQAAIQDSLNYTVEPYLTPENEGWNLSEQLAQGDFKAVVDRAKALTAPSSTVLQCLARAQGALGELEAYQQTWEQIAQQSDPVHLGYADWFYLPEAVAEAPAFWAQIETLAPRVQELELSTHETLETHYGATQTVSELVTALAQYHRYTLQNDAEGLARLRKQYPKWEAL